MLIVKESKDEIESVIVDGVVAEKFKFPETRPSFFTDKYFIKFDTFIYDKVSKDDFIYIQSTLEALIWNQIEAKDKKHFVPIIHSQLLTNKSRGYIIQPRIKKQREKYVGKGWLGQKYGIADLQSFKNKIYDFGFIPDEFRFRYIDILGEL